MQDALNCIANISEGRDGAAIEAMAGAVRLCDGVRLVRVSPDADHNRTVYSFAGAPDAVLESAKSLAAEALERIDMARHNGEHPRIGAVDVVPFVTMGRTPQSEALRICRAFGRWLGGLGVPVYYYGAAAVSPGREALPDVRRGQYEGLPQKLGDPAWAPDEGPAAFNARSGATAVGVRPPLVAFNVNLATDDLEVAKAIAKAVRHSGGGYRYVRAIGVRLASAGGIAQVSMNLLDTDKTPIPRVLETVRSEAARRGVAVAGTEVIGALPAAAIEEVMRHYLQCHSFEAGQILELVREE